MLTIDALEKLGADTVNGIARCTGDESFYLRMVALSLGDDSFEQLKNAIESKSLDNAFERAHALKGVLGNVGLTSLYEPIAKMTEELRKRKDIDYSDYITTIETELKKYRDLL